MKETREIVRYQTEEFRHALLGMFRGDPMPDRFTIDRVTVKDQEVDRHQTEFGLHWDVEGDATIWFVDGTKEIIKGMTDPLLGQPIGYRITVEVR